ncbi:MULTISPECIES: hypothetical protein [Cryobacterium]|uniref:hypothetical protein n=1 Tax=Cryobacterium TaxID=69578 RepID=UPI000CD3B260|nr:MULTISPECIES: hypothetical protein [Cryobacterium]POH63679.1 hypothetical protein C3B60_16340 [Cryobacterium zongtaii]TFC40811.1 hypothetical protein E3O57_17950 [Cryobacterium sp. TMN-39-2]
MATTEQSTVETSAEFQLDHVPVGSVEVADPKELLELVPPVFTQRGAARVTAFSAAPDLDWTSPRSLPALRYTQRVTASVMVPARAR